MAEPPRPPGWYSDPWGTTPDAQRYFDGTSWSRNDSPEVSGGSGPRRRSRWWLPLVLVVGAVGGAVWFSGGLSSSPSKTSVAQRSGSKGSTTSSSRGQVHIVLRPYGRGDCITWKQIPGETRSVETVSCAKPHLMEVIAPVDLVGYSNRLPDGFAWGLIAEKECLPIADAYLGVPVDPRGRFDAYVIHPLADGWARGDRKIWCGLTARITSLVDASTLTPVSGRIRGDQQTSIEPIGICLTTTPEGNELAVDCATSHEVEVTGSIDLSQRIDHQPTNSELIQLTATECDRLAGVYLGHALGSEFATASRGFDPRSWAAGRRAVECLVGRQSAGAWAPVSGSIRTGA